MSEVPLYGLGLRVRHPGRDARPHPHAALGNLYPGFGFRGPGFGFRVSGSGIRVWGVGFGVSGFRFGFWGLGFRNSGSGYQVWASPRSLRRSDWTRFSKLSGNEVYCKNALLLLM